MSNIRAIVEPVKGSTIILPKNNSDFGICVEKVEYPMGDEFIQPIGVIDVNSTTRNADRLIDGSLTNVVSGKNGTTTNKAIAAIDYGSVKSLGLIEIYWIDINNIPSSFKAQGSTNGTVWTDITQSLTPVFEPNTPTIPQTIKLVNANYRYIRLFVESTTGSAWKLSEIRAFSTPTSYHNVLDTTSDGLIILEDESSVTIKNNSDINYKITLSNAAK